MSGCMGGGMNQHSGWILSLHQVICFRAHEMMMRYGKGIWIQANEWITCQSLTRNMWARRSPSQGAGSVWISTLKLKIPSKSRDEIPFQQNDMKWGNVFAFCSKTFYSIRISFRASNQIVEDLMRRTRVKTSCGLTERHTSTRFIWLPLTMIAERWDWNVHSWMLDDDEGR
jgi:hypothetical protein